VLQAPSLSINHMPPRTTRKSYRPRVSDRTMVGIAQPLCLFASEAEGRRYHITMNDESAEKRKSQRLVALLGLEGKTIPPAPSSRREGISLDIPFYRTRLSESGRATPRTRLLREVPNSCFVRWFCSGHVLLLDWLAPADVFRCSLADETLASPCMFSTAITFFHSLNDRFPLPPTRGVLR
jgi:hypothetical protein